MSSSYNQGRNRLTKPCSPSGSPWSLVKTTSVSSMRPIRRNASKSLPSQVSTRVTDPA